MTSIFQRALGDDFGRLHPELRRRFGVSVAGGEACVGSGVMERVWHGGWFTRPFLALGSRRNLLFPETGRDVPFVIRNYPYVDPYGRETVTFVRAFDFPRRRRRFDATMVYDPVRDCVVDHLGTHQHVATDLSLAVDDAGGLVIRSGAYRIREGPLACRLPDVICGAALVSESYDDETGRFRIAVTVVNRRFGPLFGYRGSFTVRYVDLAEAGVPADVRPRRERMPT